MRSHIKLGLQALPEAGSDKWPMCSPSDSSEGRPPLPAGQNWPKISIVTPSYNQGAYLEKTIRSVLLQGYPNLEYIIIDGGSKDNSLEIIEQYSDWIDYWISEPDRGQSHAINKGLDMATGELLGWLNSDDWLSENALFKLASAYLEDPTVGVIYGQGYIVDVHGNVTHRPKLVQVDEQSLLNWANGSDFMQPSCLFTKEAWLSCGPLDEYLNFSMDVDLWLKIAKRYHFRRIDDLLSFSLTHPEAKTTAFRNAMFADLVVVLIRHGGETQARGILDHLVQRLNRLENTIVLSRVYTSVRRWGKRLLGA